MFLANSLKEKLKRSYLENDSDAFGKPPFPYNPPPNDPRVLLSFKGSARGLPSAPSEEFTTQKLQALDKKEWESKFTLSKLRKEWETKVELDFENKHKKFSDDMMLPKVLQSKEYVKELIDPDILELKQKRWNISSDCQTKIRPELKKTLFEVSHGLKDFKVVPLKEHIVEEGVDSRNSRIIDGMKWEISTKIEENEKKYLHEITKEIAKENSTQYWKENEYNRLNGEPLPISEERKKLEIIRYFKKYRTPYQKSLDLYRTMKKVRDLTALERAEVEKSVLYRNPGSKYKEKINAIVFREMFNTYRYKYNELTGKLDKEEIKKRQREENKFHWKDEDLVDKIIQINNLEDIKWFKPEFVSNRLCHSQEKLKKELLKPLVIKGNDIHIEQEKIKEKLDEEYKKQQKRELLLKQKKFPKKTLDKIATSKYPISKSLYESLSKTQNDDDISKCSISIKNQMINSMNNSLGGEMNKSNDDDHFLEAYQKVAEAEVGRLNKLYRKNKDNIHYLYSHPGTYREFDFDEKKKKIMTSSNEPNENSQPQNVEQKGQGKTKLWSCCMNADEKSKGCQRSIVKKFKWIYDEPDSL